MSKQEAWQECEDALWLIHSDRCIGLDCGCQQMIERIKGVLYV